MISKSDEFILSSAIASERIASEINSRLIEASADASAAQALLDVIKPSKKESKEIEEYLIVALTNRKFGKEVAEQLDLIVECLEYQAADSAANNAALNAAQAKIKALSKEAREYLVVCLANRPAAARFADELDAAGQVAAGIADAVI